MDEKKPTAKRHRLLDIIDNELQGAHHSKTYEVLGHSYTLRTLDPDDEAWADGNVTGDNFYQTARNRRIPYIAAAIVAIDGTSVEQLFLPPTDMPEIERRLYDESSAYKKVWLREQALTWLRDVHKHGPYVQELYGHVLDLESERGEALRKLDPLRAKTPDGGSSDMSSPEKESVLPTPVSNG